MTIEETITLLEMLQDEPKSEWEGFYVYDSAIYSAIEILRKVRDGKMIEIPCPEKSIESEE